MYRKCYNYIEHDGQVIPLDSDIACIRCDDDVHENTNA